MSLPPLPPPNRAAGLARLAGFVPRAARDYALGRNTDPGPGAPAAVSGLSPYIRHRLLTEAEVVAAVLAAHGPVEADKFIQEVFWRSYWKGWLELRPGVWAGYVARLAEAREALGSDASLRQRTEAAMAGRTGIECFDAWGRELRHTGTLHNHARMWFASIWCFTLKLPWVLGADFFLRHLLDGDPASNTLSWRWVLGSQTRGKHYVARAENIARYTQGRFNPAGMLEENPAPIIEPLAAAEAPRPLPPALPPPAGPVALLLHEDDLCAASLDLGEAEIRAVAGLATPPSLAPDGLAPAVAAWRRAALLDGVTRGAERHGGCAQVLCPQEVVAWATAHGVGVVISPYAPVGWAAQALEEVERSLAAHGLRLHRLRRPWDNACWPLATKGFFPFRESIPALLRSLLPQPGHGALPHQGSVSPL